MVTHIESTAKDGLATLRKGLFVELVGPAGVGKTSLYDALQEASSLIIGESIPSIRSPSNFSFYLRNFILLIPMLVRIMSSKDCHITRQSLVYLTLLNGWSSILQKKVGNDQQIVIIDQGPIYMMAYFSIFHPNCMKHSTFLRWWEKIKDSWSKQLDLVVYLDASNNELINRINERQDKIITHVSGRSIEYASNFLDTYRKVYKALINDISLRSQKLKRLRIETDTNSIEESAKCILSQVLLPTKDN